MTECEENCRVFDEDHVNEPDDRGGFGSGAHVGADLIVPVSEVEEYKGEHKRSAEYLAYPGYRRPGEDLRLARGPRRA